MTARVDNELLNRVFAIPGKVAIVTGGGSGIGAATATMLSQAGAHVVVADLDGAAAATVAAAIVGAGGKAIAVTVDVQEELQVLAMATAASAAFGGIDILVNNAAYRPKAEFMDMSVETWDRMHHVNTRGAFLCMRAAIAAMRTQGAERGGAIVNISTIGAAHPTVFGNTHYDSSKAALNGLTRSAASEFAVDGIRINAIMPGGVDTEGSRRMRSGEVSFVPRGPIMGPGRLPLGVAKPDQLASAILFLCGPASSYMTGHVMAVDGGYLVS